MSRRVVAASPNGYLKLVGAREVEGRSNVIAPETANDHRGPAIDECVETATRAVELRTGRRENIACQRAPQIVDVHREYQTSP